MISGMIPQSIYNLSLLEIFSVADNTLQGSLPHNVGVALPRIQRFRAWGNQFTGPIPVSFANASSLSELDLSMNKFFGEVPNIFGNLKNFTWLGVGYNDLRSGKVNDMSFITSLTNCSNLRILNLEHSYFGGELPKSIGNLSDRLEILVIGGNEISGSIPPGIGNLVGLNSLQIYENHLKGTIPATIGKLHKLQGFFSEENELSGEIPSSIGNLTLLTELTLDENNFGGSIPSSMGKCKNLLMLSVYGNSFNGTIPQDVLGLSSLATSLDLSRNSFTGPLHGEVGNLKNLVELKISHNELSGEIPTRLGDCTMLERLYLDHNLLEGRIPESLSSLKGIVEMDLSHNKLVGQIPKDIAKLKFLSKLNLSFNDLYGEMPTGGVFGNVSAVSIAGNDKLCGGIPELGLVACSEEKPKKHNLSLIISLVCVLGVCLMLSSLVICWIKDKKKSLESLESESSMNVSYGELLKATNGFSPENLIGTGSFGSVYKGVLEANQTSIAVKVFNLIKRGASRSFLAECETLKNTRHRNLVKVITACSSVDYQGNDFKAIVYELMLNGSLDSWLHPHQHTEDLRKKSLTLYQRLNMAIDVASAVDYLHNRTELSIVHCDLKPSNILLDEDMTAHVGDFGLSRILAQDNDQVSHDQTSSIGIKGTMGYAAPGNFSFPKFAIFFFMEFKTTFL
ncbi:Serine/threonine protein kinase [Parasponia andersonii]|uniref:non-specific serine/threonine protein kinase n=1 Tax=Parasponia andersonii TaxID=3476 RepID=A0A2P5CM22_PARAD|nr:Serine/threonine protein kinase [Parasponia andersonii]